MRVFILLASISAIYWLLKLAFGKRNGTITEQPNQAFFHAALLGGLAFHFGTAYFGNMTPGSFFERSEYQGEYIVRLYPDEKRTKSYLVPAEISARVESMPDTAHSDFYYREYRVYTALFPDGRKIVFSDTGNVGELNKIVSMTDKAGNHWGVELTNQRVNRQLGSQGP